MLWKDANENLYDDDNGAALALSSWPKGLTQLTAAQIMALQTPTAAQQWMAYQGQARAALSASDTTMHRIAEAVALGATTWTTANVVAFASWRKALRAILTQTQPATIPTALPAMPPYPSGT